MAETLFTVTTDNLDKGLREYPVGHVWTSWVNPKKGVSYVGYPVEELAGLDPEKVIYLLFHKNLPTDAEDKAFRADLVRRSKMPPEVIPVLKALPKKGHPMEWLIAGLSAMGMAGKTNNYNEDALNLVARISELVAAIFRIRSGWGEPIASKPELGYAENFVHMLGAPKSHKELGRLMRAFHILHMDHGGGNLSTFTGKAVASGLADIYSSLAAAMAGLYGPRHGRANQDCLEFVKKVANPDREYIRKFTEDLLAKGGLVFGFGHAVLRVEDSRAGVQYEIAKKYFSDDNNVKVALAMRDVVPEVLKKNPKISNPYPNVDAISGSLLNAAGLTDSDYFTVLFGWSRCAGIAAQIIDEQTKFRGGKGVPIYRCKYIPENQPERHLNNSGQ